MLTILAAPADVAQTNSPSSSLFRSALASALPCPAGRLVPGRGGPERRRRPRPDGTGAPMLTWLLTGPAVTPQDEGVRDETTLRHPPSSKAWKRPGEHWPTHRVCNLGPGASSSPDRHSDAVAESIACSIRQMRRRLPVAGSGAEKNQPQPLPCRRVPPLTVALASV
jgi:hypothetical protein